jgi:hypothetical protein
MNSQEEIRNKIDDYEQTIHAMIGFMNFYRYDDTTKTMKEGVIVFQGRRFEPSSDKATNAGDQTIRFVTPDFGVVWESRNGILGEVKKSFPKDQDLWMKPFAQLMSYDDDLKGWPTSEQKIASHDLVLLLHQTRAAAVLRFYRNNEGSRISFKRPFIIVQFNRADERKPYYFFQKSWGSLTEKSLDVRLVDGVPVPMEIFITTYSTIKIYDSEPPAPYLMELIWTNVVLPTVSEDPKFEKLRKNQKIEVPLEIDTIIEQLHQGFSFCGLCRDNPERQPRIPKREWVINACEMLVNSDEAEWVETGRTKIKVFFRRYDDVLDHFIQLCSQTETKKQLSLFKNSKPK